MSAQPHETPQAPASPAGRWQPPSASELAAMLPDYAIIRLLGRGGMGAVYEGRQKNLDRPVAIKILPPGLEETDPSYHERFKNEALAMAKLNHPGIVKVYDFGQTSAGMLYIVMEFIEGTDVARMIAEQGRLHTDHAMAVTAHVCDALASAHECGIIHRDIKPANIMVSYDGVVKVADFGLAKMSHGGESGLTRSGMTMGTLHYMAPEALTLGAAVDHRADIYAVGVMLYHMLVGRLPQGTFKLPSSLIAGLDPRYDAIISEALRENRDKRYQTIQDLRHSLDRILTEPVPQVKADSKATPPAAFSPKSRPQRATPPPTRPLRTLDTPRVRKKSLPVLQAAAIVLGLITLAMIWQRVTAPTTLVEPSPATESPVEEEPMDASPPITAMVEQRSPLPLPTAAVPGPWLDPFPVALTHYPNRLPDGTAYWNNNTKATLLSAERMVLTRRSPGAGKYIYNFRYCLKIEGAFAAELRLQMPASTLFFEVRVPVGARYLLLRLDLRRHLITSPSLAAPQACDWLTTEGPRLLTLSCLPTPGKAGSNTVILLVDGRSACEWHGQETELPPLDTSNVNTSFAKLPNLLPFAIELEGPSVFTIESYRLRSLGGNITLTPKQPTAPAAATIAEANPKPAAKAISPAELAAIRHFNGHAYLFKQGVITWTEAEAMAEQIGGHLATITSREENDFIIDLCKPHFTRSNAMVWLGAQRAKEGDHWTWVTGEPWGFSNWTYPKTGERTQSSRTVGDMLVMMNGKDGYVWNDFEITSNPYKRYVIGFVVEWETPPAAMPAAAATKDQPWTNSLGMKFVPLPGTQTLICIHQTRQQDYAAYATANPGIDDLWQNPVSRGMTLPTSTDRPVVGISWNDATAFCEWLSQQENRRYRLPSDREWSLASGIGDLESPNGTPTSLHNQIKDRYFWGSQWPPPAKTGNYADATLAAQLPKQNIIPGYADGFATTAPVMSFPPNPIGLHDLGGNVLEWCADWYDETHTLRVLRGGSWGVYGQSWLMAATRQRYAPDKRSGEYGFRCLLDLDTPSVTKESNVSAIDDKPTTTKPAGPPPR